MNHKGVRYLRTGFATCICKHVITPTGVACTAINATESQLEVQGLARELQSEMLRKQVIEILMPPIFASVPEHDKEGKLQVESGWNLCRSCPTEKSISDAAAVCEDQSVIFPSMLLCLAQSMAAHSSNLSEGWMAVVNRSDRGEVRRGDVVLCSFYDSALQEYGSVVEILARHVFRIELHSGVVVNLHRDRFKVISGEIFLFNAARGISTWNAESGSSHPIPTSPWRFSGSEWTSVLSRATFRRAFKNYDEYFDLACGKAFFVNIALLERETAARVIQKLLRTKLNFCQFLEWRSSALSFEKPAEVCEEEKRLNAWTYLRRRSASMGFFKDMDGDVWEEYVDSESADYFYWNRRKNEFRWLKPMMRTGITSEDMLQVGESVLYRFTEEGTEEVCTVVKRRRWKVFLYIGILYSYCHFLRRDDETEINMYIVVLKEGIQLSEWIPRIALKRLPLSLEAASLKRMESMWVNLIRRRRLARNEKVVKDGMIKSYYGLVAASDEEEALNNEDLSSRAEARLALAAQEALDFVNARKATKQIVRARKSLDLTIALENNSAMSSKSELIRFQKSMELRLKIEEKVEARLALRKVSAEEREVLHKLYVHEEEKLRVAESGMTTPRSMRRRKLVRELHRAMRRQKEGLFICEMGCKEWMRYGSLRDAHLLQQCRFRQVCCSLGCGMHLTDDQWLNEGFQLQHETEECESRLVLCPLGCLDWVVAKDMSCHLISLCPKRDGKVLHCRLGCGLSFGGSVEDQLEAEDSRYSHEFDECENRMVSCTWRYDGNKACGAMIVAKDRDKHRMQHGYEGGVSLYRVPGSYAYRVPERVTLLKIQFWGAGAILSIIII